MRSADSMTIWNGLKPDESKRIKKKDCSARKTTNVFRDQAGISFLEKHLPKATALSFLPPYMWPNIRVFRPSTCILMDPDYMNCQTQFYEVAL